MSTAVGLFGILATLGRFSYELHGIKKCGALIDAGRLIEQRLTSMDSSRGDHRRSLDSLTSPLAAQAQAGPCPPSQ